MMYTYLYLYVYIYFIIYICIYIYIYIHMYITICAYIFRYIYTHPLQLDRRRPCRQALSQFPVRDGAESLAKWPTLGTKDRKTEHA